MSNLGDVLSKLVQLKRITDGGLKAKPPAAGGYWGPRAKPPAASRFFCSFFGKKSYFNAIGSHFARVQSHLKELKF